MEDIETDDIDLGKNRNQLILIQEHSENQKPSKLSRFAAISPTRASELELTRQKSSAEAGILDN